LLREAFDIVRCDAAGPVIGTLLLKAALSCRVLAE
jgi:hypothetical protein